MTPAFRDTHVRDTHRSEDSHSACRHCPRDSHRRDTHIGDTHQCKDTHPRDEDAHPSSLWDTHVRDTHRGGDTHRSKDTHRGEDTQRREDTHSPPRSVQGFVLIATLWTLAAMAVLAAYIDGVASADIERATVAKAALERELARRSTEETLGYLLATGRMNHRGLMLEPEQSFSDVEGNRGPDRSVGVIAVSGEAYAGVGGTRFSVQDENGLVSVNYPRTANFTAALLHVGVASTDVTRIVPRVEDYVDMDDDLRLSGAERFDYERTRSPDPAGRTSAYRTSVIVRTRDRAPIASGTAPGPGSRTASQPRPPSDLRFPNPSNWTMITPVELKRVLGVDAVITPVQWRRLLPMLTMRQTTGFNFNTMPRDVLESVLELDRGTVNNILAERAERPVSSVNHIAMLTGTHVDMNPEDVRGLPSRFLRVSIWHNASGLRSIVGMALTPYGDAPWRIDYRYMEPMTEPTEPTALPGSSDPARAQAEPTGAHRDPTEPAIDNESSDAGVLQAATPLLQ